MDGYYSYSFDRKFQMAGVAIVIIIFDIQTSTT